MTANDEFIVGWLILKMLWSKHGKFLNIAKDIAFSHKLLLLAGKNGSLCKQPYDIKTHCKFIDKLFRIKR